MWIVDADTTHDHIMWIVDADTTHDHIMWIVDNYTNLLMVGAVPTSTVSDPQEGDYVSPLLS